MSLRLRSVSVYACALSLVFACSGGDEVKPSQTSGGSSGQNGNIDANGDKVPDDIGKLVDENKDGEADTIDVNGDGKPDGWAIDINGDGKPDGLLLDTDCDGLFESYDTNKDGKPDYRSSAAPMKTPPAGCMLPPLSGAGGSSGTGGSSGVSGSPGASGSAPTGGGGAGGSSPVASELGKGAYQGTGESTDRYWEDNVIRNGVGYKFIANGWGPGFQSHNIAYNGTSFKITAFSGTKGGGGEPSGFPTVFCGLYADRKQSQGECGLPTDISALKELRTGMRWAANGNNGEYNTSWDIWLGNGGSLSSYLMVWLRFPPNEAPAGSNALSGVTVAGVPGTWRTVVGNVTVEGMTRPIVNYVRERGQDLAELEYDVMAFYNDAKMRNYNLPGNQVLAVAAGFEIWSGPISNLEMEDFYVDVVKK